MVALMLGIVRVIAAPNVAAPAWVIDNEGVVNVNPPGAVDGVISQPLDVLY